MKYIDWKIKQKYPKNPIKAIIKERKKESGFVLNPPYEDLSSPDKIHDLIKASKIIREKIAEGGTVGVFMDYDADGVCAGAILYKTIRWLKGKVEYYVPLRSEGYGLSERAIDKLRDQGVSLIVTVDCGIKNHQEIEYAKKKGLGVIVTDHHLWGDHLPKADALVHPAINNKGMNFSGAGVAFQLARKLLNDGGRVKWLLDLASISTIADIVPLVGDNRIIVKYGLVVINKTKNLGLKHLVDIIGLCDRGVGSYEVGYMIAPRLNAAGRLTKPMDSFKLLISSEDNEAKRLAVQLHHYNEVRQKQLSDSVEESLALVEKEELYKNNIIVIVGKWNEGIVGLISGKLTEVHYKPSIVLTKVDGKLKGSARSIPGVDISNLIGKFEKDLLSYGGHKQAAGLSISESNIKKFIKDIKKEASKISKKLFERRLIIDALMRISDIDIDFAKDIMKLAPFGMGNPQPVICVKGVKVRGSRLVGRDKSHMSLQVCDKDNFCKAIIFNYNKDMFDIKEGDSYDFAFRVMIDTWRGRQKVSLNILDAKKNK